MIPAILNRRSIRKYQPMAVPRSIVEEILQAGMLAPSSKNRQPWKFIVVTGSSKHSMLEAVTAGLERERKSPFLPQSAKYLAGAENSLRIMTQAPTIIFIINTLGIDLNLPLTVDERVSEICNSQSIGAAIENMTLAAADFGLGSLWICDTFFAQKELKEWLHADGELFAAMAIGYADEQPTPRPRKELHDVIEWRE